MSIKRYLRFDRIPKGFARTTKLAELKAGDEIVWHDDGIVSIVETVELSGERGTKARPYRVRTRTADGEAYEEVIGASTKLFVRPSQA